MGKLILQLFKDRVVEFTLNNFGGESLILDQFSIDNLYVIHGKVIDLIDEVLVLENHLGQRIYVNSTSIDCFWEPGTKMIESISTIIPTGKRLKKEIQ